NLGGISNVTYVPASGRKGSVQAFDTGPGNMVLDSLIAKVTAGRLSMDREGKLALKGRVNDRLLGKLLAHPFLSKRPPKSTSREEIRPHLIEELVATQQKWGLSLEDLLATCSLWTAKAVGTARRWIHGAIDEVVVGGFAIARSWAISPLSLTRFRRRLSKHWGGTVRPLKQLHSRSWHIKQPLDSGKYSCRDWCFAYDVVGNDCAR